MPELPEVETVKNSLNDLIIGKSIRNCEVYYERMLQNITKQEFEKQLIGETFIEMSRIGKYLLFVMKKHIMVAHLRMEGKYFLKDNEPIDKHEHVIFNLTDGKTLRYNDTRKFGVIYLFNTNDIDLVRRQKPLSQLGIEPISGNLSIPYLKNKFKRCTKPIKTALLDQTIISGLGNIYADEVCFMSHINPLKKSCELDDGALQRIIDSSKMVLEKAITLGGTTIKSFVSSHAVTGRFQNELLVHTKTICPDCQGTIEKIYIGGRGTYYCPNCQK